MKRILVVEDESRIARLVRDYLEHAGFEVVVAGDGEVALAEARRARPDLVVLDLGLPGRDGLDVARSLRRTSNVPIVMLTARGDETDRIVGLELGADDYVVKPFSPKELVARVRAVLRRTEAAGPGGPRCSGSPTSRSTCPACGSRSAAGRSSSPRPSSSCWRPWSASRAGCSPAASSWTRSTASPSSPTSGRSTPTSRTSARRSSPPPGPPRYLLTVHGVGYRFADA